MKALKYADSTQQCEGWRDIVVRQDGIGFDLAAAAVIATTSNFGLFSIRERMRALGRWLGVQSALGKGTTTTLVQPILNARAPSSECGTSVELKAQNHNCTAGPENQDPAGG